VALLAPDLVPVSLLMLMIPLNVYVAWREWETLDRSGVTWTTVGRFLGTFGGLRLLTILTHVDRVRGRLLRVSVLLFAIVSGTVLLTRN